MENQGSEHSCVQINIEEILEAKAPSLKRKLPGFVISYLKKILHQDEINYVFRTYGHLQGIDFADAIMTEHFHITTRLTNSEMLPDDSHVIFVCNHPIGSIDGIALIQALGRKYPQFKIPVNDFLMYIKNLEEFFIPVNKIKGRGQSRNISTLLNDALSSDCAVLFFPSGECSRRQDDGSVRDNEWKKTFISKAKEFKRDIIPLYFEGHNSKWFLNLSYYRKKLGIKTNIEMLYLSDEMFKQKNNTFAITVGDRIPYTLFDESRSDKEWADYVKQISYSLKK